MSVTSINHSWIHRCHCMSVLFMNHTQCHCMSVLFMNHIRIHQCHCMFVLLINHIRIHQCHCMSVLFMNHTQCHCMCVPLDKPHKDPLVSLHVCSFHEPHMCWGYTFQVSSQFLTDQGGLFRVRALLHGRPSHGEKTDSNPAT